MDWRTRIVANPDVLVGKPVIKGTRISVELVMDLLAAGGAESARSIEARGVFAISSRLSCAGKQASERFRTLEAQAKELGLC